MDATNFTWQVFTPLAPHRAFEIVGATQAFAAGYPLWLGEFEHRWEKFNHAQRTRYEEHLYRAFCWEMGLDDSIGLLEWDYDYADVFRQFMSQYRYDEYVSKTEDVSYLISRWYGNAAPRQHGLTSASDIVERMYTKRPGEELLPKLWSAWFAQETEAPADKAAELCHVPYRDYLKSPYWKRVRAAMLLIYETHCQGAPCVSLDSWYGGEFDLNVHHLHYKNKGREQLDNLALICSDCHRRVHAGDAGVLLDRPAPGAEAVRV